MNPEHAAWISANGLEPLDVTKRRGGPLSPAELAQRKAAAQGRGGGRRVGTARSAAEARQRGKKAFRDQANRKRDAGSGAWTRESRVRLAGRSAKREMHDYTARQARRAGKAAGRAAVIGAAAGALALATPTGRRVGRDIATHPGDAARTARKVGSKAASEGAQQGFQEYTRQRSQGAYPLTSQVAGFTAGGKHAGKMVSGEFSRQRKVGDLKRDLNRMRTTGTSAKKPKKKG